jgi:hypothetical protein
MEVSGQLHPRPLYPRWEKAIGTHLIRVWVGLIAGLDLVAKRTYPRSYRESNPDRPVTILTELQLI